MELEYAFFAAQSVKDSVGDEVFGEARRLQKTTTGSSVSLKMENGIHRERLTGVHERVALFCVDFDDTLTEGDTTTLLMKIAAAQV